MGEEQFCVVLFNSVNHTMYADKILNRAGISYKLIPVPKNLSSDCGVCLRVKCSDIPETEKALSGKVENAGIHAL